MLPLSQKRYWGASLLSVCFRSGKGTEHALTLRNTEADIKGKLLPQLFNYQGKIVMESTGHYHWLALLLLKEAGLDMRIVNPLLAKQYTTGNIRKVKTDPADAASLARMAEVADSLPPPFSLSKEKLYARKKLAVIGSMSHQLQALSASLKSLRNRLKSLFRSEISEMRAKMMKDEEAYTEYTSTNPESFAAEFLKL